MDPSSNQFPRLNSAAALRRAIVSLRSLQAANGSWEGEVIWCPMLAAQFVLMCHITHTPIPPKQREGVLLQFLTTRLPSGVWGLHEKSEPFLFVTTLVYVAARILGVERDDPLLVPARQFIQAQGGVVAIPTSGKFWLAMLNLYDWQGLYPVLPEVWRLPSWVPAHPSNLYCHTRLIYMPTAYIYGRKFQAPLTLLTQTLRSELYVGSYQSVDFSAARGRLRTEEVSNPPGARLRVIYHISAAYERWYSKRLRERTLAELIDHVRYDLATTNYTSLSSVSGLLNLIALWLNDPNDKYLYQGLEHVQQWMWQDDRHGLRIAGARSSTWDTAFAIQSLQTVSQPAEVAIDLSKALKFLADQQIRITFPNFERYHRINPRGGFCFAGVWHGWPVSDCTAEALLALMEAPPQTISRPDLVEAVLFMLRCQNSDGGFGSYERRRMAPTLEWMNPAEMFSNSMTEHSYVECTASCLAALRKFRGGHPGVLEPDIDTSIHRAGSWLRRQQRPDGSWPGFWGVYFIYGTMFGIQGLLAAGAQPDDPAIGQACHWLITKQRPDGGWGEHFQGCLTGQYVEHSESQVIQTAWAMIGLLRAHAPQWDVSEQGATFLMDMQLENGDWPKQDPAGLFFKTALLDYSLYRSYFPVMALGLYESQRVERRGTASR